MEKLGSVEFRNVGKMYFPQSRVDCHYSLSSGHKWTNADWIGIFKVDWGSLKEYHTFAWALVNEGYTEGIEANCCAHFQASYLPRPTPLDYQFVYVDGKGAVCARSRSFRFCSPKPLDELVTLEEDGGEEEEEQLLLVMPRAHLLQSQLEKCQKEKAELKQRLAATEEEERRRGQAREEWEREREGMKELLRQWEEEREKEQEKNKDAQCSQDATSAELSGLWADRAASHQRIKRLEEELSGLSRGGRAAEEELDRMRERVKKMSAQRWDDEQEKKNMQAEREALLLEARSLQERLEASERGAESLRKDRNEAGAKQSQGQAELHQARLQAAQLTLQLSEASLALREGRASWAQERETHRLNAECDKERLQKASREVQRKEEWLQEERAEREKLEGELEREKHGKGVQLSEALREVQELRVSLQLVQKENKQQQLERRELLDYIRELEQKLEATEDARWSEVASSFSTPAARGRSEPEKLPNPTRSLSESPQMNSLIMAKRVVVLTQPGQLFPPQPSMEEAPRQGLDEERRHMTTTYQAPPEDKLMILPDLTNPILCELADSPMW